MSLHSGRPSLISSLAVRMSGWAEGRGANKRVKTSRLVLMMTPGEIQRVESDKMINIPASSKDACEAIKCGKEPCVWYEPSSTTFLYMCQQQKL